MKSGTCKECGDPFPKRDRRSLYCSPLCKSRWKNKRLKQLHPTYHQEWYQKHKDAHLKRTRARHALRVVTRVKKRPGGSIRQQAVRMGFRSGYERTLDMQLKDSGVAYQYEPIKIPYELSGVYCPDFVLHNGIIIEAKGKLDSDDRRKMRAVRDQHPEYDIRFVFMNANARIVGGKQTCGEWATKNGFMWAHARIPEEWLNA